MSKDTTPATVTDTPRITDDDTNANPCQLTLAGAPETGVLVAATLYYAYQKSAPLDNIRELYLTLSQGATTLHSFTELDLLGTQTVAQIELTVADIQFDTVFTLDLDAGGTTSGKGSKHREVWINWVQVELIFKDQATLTTVPMPINAKGVESVFCGNTGSVWGYNDKIFLPPVPNIESIDPQYVNYRISGVFTPSLLQVKQNGFFTVCTTTAAYYLSFADVLTEGTIIEVDILDVVASYTVQAGDGDPEIALGLKTAISALGFVCSDTNGGVLVNNIVGFFSEVTPAILVKARTPYLKVKTGGQFIDL